MSGMKAGSADDPFADDDAEDETASSESASEEPEPRRDDPLDAGADRTATTATGQAYVDRRGGAKDERRLVQFFLRDEVYGEMTEARLRSEIGEELGEMPGKFDLREALVAVGQEHEDEVLERLREMGL